MLARLLPCLGALLVAVPCAGIETLYRVSGDETRFIASDGTVLRPGTVFGSALIDDDGGGTPTLRSLEIRTAYRDELSFGFAVGLSIAEVEFEIVASPAPDQTGSGSTNTQIVWGTLGGWTQSGVIHCRSLLCLDVPCPSAPQPTLACLQLVGFADGIGAFPPLASTEFTPGPWVFDAVGDSFSAASPLELTNENSGAFMRQVVFDGTRVSVPLASLGASALLGASVVLLGVRSLRRRRPARRA